MSKLQEKFAIAKFLENVVVPDEVKDGWMRYVDGCSDSFVAGELDTSKQLVVSVRRALYGSNFIVPQRKRGSNVRLAALEERVAALERKVDEISQEKIQWVNDGGGPSRVPPPLIPRWDK